MQGLVALWLVINGLLYFPLFVVVWGLKYGLPSALFPKNLGDGLWFNRGLRSIGVARFEKLFQLFDTDLNDHTVLLAVIPCVLHFIDMFIIMLAAGLEEPMAFIPDVEGVPYMGQMYEFFLFALNINFIHLLPVIVHILVLLYWIPLPFLEELKKNRTQETNDIKRCEKDSEGLAWIRLSRFENSEKTFIYANCRDECSGKVFKLVLCQGKKTGDRTQCFLYSDDESTLEQINPAPVSVNELDEIFIPDGESNSEQVSPAPVNGSELNETHIPDNESSLEHINLVRVSSNKLNKIFISDDDEVSV